jgi:TonB family protein
MGGYVYRGLIGEPSRARTRWIAVASIAWLSVCSAQSQPGPPVSSAAASSGSSLELYVAPRPTVIHSANCKSPNRGLDASACAELEHFREGWVELNFMVDSAGKPFEVTVSHSTGNKVFDADAVEAIAGSTFDPGTLNGIPVESGYELRYRFFTGPMRPFGGESEDFAAVNKSFKRAMAAGDRAAAEAAMKKFVIANLYDDANFGINTYNYARKWGDEAQQLKGLERAAAGGSEFNYLPKDIYGSVLKTYFGLQVNSRLYAEALETYAWMQKAGLDANTMSKFAGVLESIRKIQTDDSAYEIPGAMPEGDWHVKLFKRHFQIAVGEGAVSQVKLRCQKRYVYFPFDPKLEYTVAGDYGSCTMELDGTPGTRFKLTQY